MRVFCVPGLSGKRRSVQSLVVHLEHVADAREPWARTLSKSWLADGVFATAKGFRAVADTEFKARLTRIGGNSLLVEASFKVPVESDCRRCLTAVTSALPVEYTLQFVRRAPEKKAAAEPHGKRGRKSGERDEAFAGAPDDDGEGDLNASFDENDTEQEPFDGEQVDLGPSIREQLLLALPTIEPVCKDTCKGLCSTCGQDLNDKDCGHSQKAPDPRWAALGALKLAPAGKDDSKTPKA